MTKESKGASATIVFRVDFRPLFRLIFGRSWRSVIECGGLPEDMLAAHPDIVTFDQIFYDVLRVAHAAEALASQQVRSQAIPTTT